MEKSRQAQGFYGVEDSWTHSERAEDEVEVHRRKGHGAGDLDAAKRGQRKRNQSSAMLEELQDVPGVDREVEAGPRRLVHPAADPPALVYEPKSQWSGQRKRFVLLTCASMKRWASKFTTP